MIMELLASIALATILVMTFSATMHKVRELETLALAQGRALVVLANALERLEAAERVDLDTARQVLEIEFAWSALDVNDRFSAVTEVAEGRIALKIVRADGRPVALVELGP